MAAPMVSLLVRHARVVDADTDGVMDVLVRDGIITAGVPVTIPGAPAADAIGKLMVARGIGPDQGSG